MVSILKIVFFLMAGIAVGLSSFAKLFLGPDISSYALYALMFLIGILIGGDERSWLAVKNIDRKIFLIPVTIAVGSLVGAGVAGLFLQNIGLSGALAAGSGFGYYSASAVIAGKLGGATVGSITLLANIFREIATFFFAPGLRKHFGPLSPIAVGGATAMDTTLAAIARASGKEYVPIALFSGFILTIAAPFLISLILGAF